MGVAAVSPQAEQGRYTWDDFVALPDDDKRELFDGFLVECDMATELHEYLTALFIAVLFAWAQKNGGKVLAAAYKVRVSANRGVMPDVQYFKPGRKNPPQALTTGAPDLVVEVVSPTSQRYDRVTKLRYYQQIGVPEYWLVDPEAQTLHRFVLVAGPDGSVWQTTHALSSEDGDFTPPSFGGLAIAMGTLFVMPQ